MSDKTPDENRNTDLRRDSGYGKTPVDAQQQLDWAHQALVINSDSFRAKAPNE